MAMDQTLYKLSFVNNDRLKTLIVMLHNHSSGCLNFHEESTFANVPMDPGNSFTVKITSCAGGEIESLVLQNDQEQWTQSVNGGPVQKITVGNHHRPPGSGPLFRLVPDGSQSGVVIVGTVDIDV